MISVPTGKDRSDLLERMQQAAEVVKAMSPEERAIMHAQQAESFVRSCVDNPPDHTDDPLPYLIAANERLHAEVQRLTDRHVIYAQSVADYRDCIETYRDAANALQAEMLGLRSENDTLRADLATSEQTIAALKAQLRRVKEAAE